MTMIKHVCVQVCIWATNFISFVKICTDILKEPIPEKPATLLLNAIYIMILFNIDSSIALSFIFTLCTFFLIHFILG